MQIHIYVKFSLYVEENHIIFFQKRTNSESKHRFCNKSSRIIHYLWIYMYEMDQIKTKHKNRKNYLCFENNYCKSNCDHDVEHLIMAYHPKKSNLNKTHILMYFETLITIWGIIRARICENLDVFWCILRRWSRWWHYFFLIWGIIRARICDNLDVHTKKIKSKQNTCSDVFWGADHYGEISFFDLRNKKSENLWKAWRSIQKNQI